MDRGWGSFRIVSGDVSVGRDAIRIDRTPRKFLQGQLSRRQDGDHWQQLRVALEIVWFLLVPLFAVYHLYDTFGTSIGATALLAVGTVAVNLFGFWRKYLRASRIELSDIEGITLDGDERELTITHDADGRLSALVGDIGPNWFRTGDAASTSESGETTTQLRLPTDEDVRQARTVLRTRGISFDSGPVAREESQTEYRLDARNGVVFCEQCCSQVSPGDRACPACGYVLRVEQSGEDRSQEPAVER